MLIEEYLQMRIQSAESILAGEKLAGNIAKEMAEKAAIAELRGVEAFLNNASKNSNVAQNSTSSNISRDVIFAAANKWAKGNPNCFGINGFQAGVEWAQKQTPVD